MSMCDSWWSSIPGFYGDSIRPGFDPDRIQHERWMFLWYPMVLQDAIVTMVLIPNNMMVLTMATKMLSPAGNHGSTWGKTIQLLWANRVCITVFTRKAKKRYYYGRCCYDTSFVQLRTCTWYINTEPYIICVIDSNPMLWLCCYKWDIYNIPELQCSYTNDNLNCFDTDGVLYCA